MKLLKLIPDDTNIQFLRWQWPFFIVNILAMVASAVLVFTNGLNLGVDFVGGQMIRAPFSQTAEAPVEELRGTIGGLGFGEPISRNGELPIIPIGVKSLVASNGRSS